MKTQNALSSIGVNYQLKSENSHISPEEVLINLCTDQDTLLDKKNLILLITWLLTYSKLVHVERLKAMLEASQISALSLAIMGGILSTIVKGDHRFKVILKQIHTKLGNNSESLYKDDTFLLKKSGEDPHFSQFKVSIAKLELDTPRKLKPISEMINTNVWIKNRILFGVNLRADIATIRELSLSETAYGASKIIHCSPNAAKKNWDDLGLVGF